MTSRFRQFPLARAGAALRWLLPVLLVVVLARLLADVVLMTLAGPQEPVPPNPALRRLAPVEQGAQWSLARDQVERWALFGVPPREAAPVAEAHAPDTTLRLELLGLFRHAQPERASAIIAESGRDAQLYKIGARLPGSAELVEVREDRVLLRRQGRLEALRLKEPDLGQSSRVAPSAPVARPVTPAPQVPALEGLQLTPDADLAEQRTLIIQQFGLEAVAEGGYRIRPGAPNPVLSSVGLRPGDQVMSVNGLPLGEEQGDLAALQDAVSSGAATIEVQRGSRRFTVNYPP